MAAQANGFDSSVDHMSKKLEEKLATGLFSMHRIKIQFQNNYHGKNISFTDMLPFPWFCCQGEMPVISLKGLSL